MRRERDDAFRWLLVFYTVPSQPVRNRMRVWRQLANAGAIQLKGAVYILPYREEHYEFLQWIVSEVASMGGEAGFAKVNAIETMTADELVGLFNAQREQECRRLDKALDEFERKLSSQRKGTRAQPDKVLRDQLAKHGREYDAIKKRDFFEAPARVSLGRRLEALETELRHTLGLPDAGETPAAAQMVKPQNRGDFQAKTWVTRKRPFVDRMASAWLIRKYIDDKALFEFADEKDIVKLGRGRVAFDVRGGTFTHTGDLCTFEVLLKSFSLKEKALRKIAEIVHQLDLKDDNYDAPEARGVEEILAGIGMTAKDDHDALEKGMAVFEMLYASQK